MNLRIEAWWQSSRSRGAHNVAVSQCKARHESVLISLLVHMWVGRYASGTFRVNVQLQVWLYGQMDVTPETVPVYV